MVDSGSVAVKNELTGKAKTGAGLGFVKGAGARNDKNAVKSIVVLEVV
jgi:hypothetical protein